MGLASPSLEWFSKLSILWRIDTISAIVQVFGRRQRRSNHTLWRPASALALILGTATAASAQLYGGIGQPQYGIGSNPNDHYVQPYTTQRGTYVEPHWQTNPNNTQFDNYSARGNFNPHTGVFGTRNPRY
jgi:hypothetical protein